MPTEIVVLGQVARDLVLRVDTAPSAGGAATVRFRREMLGGKGANQAVGFAQLGMSVGLIGAVGDDRAADDVLGQAAADGIEAGHVASRADAETALIVDAVDDNGQWRYFEHIPAEVLSTEHDVAEASAPIDGADAVVLQLQQPAGTALAAARRACSAGARVVLDGVPEHGSDTSTLLADADVLRADARETGYLAGKAVSDVDAAVRVGRELLERGPSLVVLEIAGAGNVFVTASDHEFLPLLDTEVVDTTGAGDALVAALTSALVRGWALDEAAPFAVAAAGATVGHVGGRPDLRIEELERTARHVR